MSNVAVIEDTQVQALPAIPQEPRGGALMRLIERAALDPSFDVAKLDKMLDVKERWDREEARRQFNEAFAKFKAEAIVIVKNTTIHDGPLKGKKHANLFDVVDAVTAKLSLHGLAISWKLSKDEKDWIEVTCTLRHVAGHTESVSMGSGPDIGPGRNAIQARASAKSYLERYTATAILGVAAADVDDDGRAAGDPPASTTQGGQQPSSPFISAKQVADLTALITEVKADKARFLKYFKVESLDRIPTAHYDVAVQKLRAKGNQ